MYMFALPLLTAVFMLRFMHRHTISAMSAGMPRMISQPNGGTVCVSRQKKPGR